MTLIQVPYGIHGQTVSRIAPVGDPRAYKTYGAVMPLRTHWRQARCEEVDCDAWRYGWVTTLDLSTAEGQQFAHAAKNDRTRRYTLQRASLTLVKLVYPAGQQCFRGHQVPNGRPAKFMVKDGDFRGNPTGYRREHKNAEDWVDDQKNTIDRVQTLLERG